MFVRTYSAKVKHVLDKLIVGIASTFIRGNSFHDFDFNESDRKDRLFPPFFLSFPSPLGPIIVFLLMYNLIALSREREREREKGKKMKVELLR